MQSPLLLWVHKIIAFAYKFCRLVLDADNTPIVVPFVHTGMQEVMPVGAMFPRVGKTVSSLCSWLIKLYIHARFLFLGPSSFQDIKFVGLANGQVTVLVGDPISFDDLISGGEDKNMSRGKLYDAVATRIGDRLQKLKLQVEALAVEQALELEKYPSRVTERAARLLQKIDWESLGMGNYMGLDEKKDPLVEPSVTQLHPKDNSHEEQSFGGAGYSVGGGFVSRIRGCMDSTELTLFGARGLYRNHRTNEYLGSLRDVTPLKTWRSLYGHVYFQPNTGSV